MRRYDILILGGGIAALSAAEAAREVSEQKSIAVIGREKELPYTRPMLTKLPLEHFRTEAARVRPCGWFEENRIEFFAGVNVEGLFLDEHRVSTSEGDFFYGKCIYALGAENFIPPFPGGDQFGVYSIRYDTDIMQIRRAALLAEHAVVIGGGVIGLEAAYQLVRHGLSVTVLETAPYLMPRILDEGSAGILKDRITMFDIKTGVKVLGMTGDGRVRAVQVEGMEDFPAELVIISCGVRGVCGVAKTAGLAVERAVVVNEKMETSAPDVYACGDCAQFRGVNTGLWAQAKEEGRTAGTNAAGGVEAYTPADQSLLFEGLEFSLFSTGDMGKDPEKSYTFTETKIRREDGPEINTRSREGLIRDAVSDGHTAGTFMIGDLTLMKEKYFEVTGRTLG